MIKKTWVTIFLVLFACAVTSFAVEYQGQTITAQDIANLPPGTIENLSPGTLDQLKNANSPEQKEAIESKAEDTTNELTKDTEKEKTPEAETDVEESDEKEPLQSVLPLLPMGSIIEEQYRHGYSSSLSSKLTQFGYNIFDSAVMVPSSLAIPDANYLVGTGDQLLIRVWGSGLDAEYTETIDREGIIKLPKVGIIPLAGVKFCDVEAILQKETQKYIQGINIKVTLTKLRSLEIFVVGAVKNPGLHMVPAFATIFDGLMAAGGVKKSGTLRQIKLNRANKQVKVFDVYDLLLKGNRNTDEILRNKDVIFVPGIGKTAAIAGAVNNEGIYEITKKSSIKDLVELCGGLLPQAFGSRIYLRRFENNQSFMINDINSTSIDEWKKIAIQNGDLVELTFSSSLLPDVVRLGGHVWSPDVFQFRQGMKLSDVLTSPVLLMPDAVTKFAMLYRYDVNTTRTIPMQFPLSKVFTGEYDAVLHSFDKITIFSRAEIGIEEKFSITGAVWKSGKYEFKTGLKLKDALALAGGLKLEARTDRIEIKRKIKTNMKFETEYIQLDLAQNSDFILQAEDNILIPMLEDYFVSLEGHVWYPEKLKYNSGMKLSAVLISKDLPKPEDLLKPDALMDFGLIERYDAVTTRTTSIRFPLADVFTGEYDAELQPFDKIKILSRQELGIAEKYSIEGAVWKKGDFDYQPGLRLNDALALAGGLKFGARKDKIEIARQNIEDNRVVTQYILVDLETDGEFLLNPYDSILVPMIKNATFAYKVTITGEVAYPGTYTIRTGEKVSDLIQRAGSFSEYAYFYGTKYTSEGARIIQQKSIDRMIEKLYLASTMDSSAMAQGAISKEDVAAAEIAGKQIQGFIARLAKIKAEGRVSIHLADLASFKNSLYDFILQPGDTIHIPEKPSFVSVVGSVYSPGSFLYEPNKKLGFYLSKSGGSTKTADEDYIYLLKANGEILSMSQNSGFFSNFENTILMPGDSIVVPEDLERVPFLKYVSVIADLAFKIATTAGVVVAISL